MEVGKRKGVYAICMHMCCLCEPMHVCTSVCICQHVCVRRVCKYAFFYLCAIGLFVRACVITNVGVLVCTLRMHVWYFVCVCMYFVPPIMRIFVSVLLLLLLVLLLRPVIMREFSNTFNHAFGE